MAEIVTFTRDSSARIAEAVRAVEASPLVRQRVRGDVRHYSAKEWRWAKATTNEDYPTYPTEGQFVVVEFGKLEPAGSEPGDECGAVWTAYEPQWTEVACCRVGLAPAQGQIIPVYRDDGRWWFHGQTFVKAVASGTITAGGSGSATLYVGGVNRGTYTVYFNHMTSGGNIASGQDLLVEWFDDESAWVIVAAECSA